MQYKFEIFADHFQFDLLDANFKWDDSVLRWAGNTVADMLDVIPGLVSIGTVRNMTVPVTIEIATSKPDDNFDGWDHVTECSLDIPSGSLVIFGINYGPEAPRIKVTPGMYRVRTYYGGLGTLRGNELEGDDNYYVILWPDTTYIEPKVLKRYPHLYTNSQ